MQGPDFPDFTINVGEIGQRDIMMESSNPNCNGTDLYEVSINSEIGAEWPSMMISEDGS